MKNFQKLKLSTMVFLMTMITSLTFSQAQWNYISPAPDAQYATIRHSIVLRSSDVIDLNSVNHAALLIEGTKSGLHKGSFKLANDGRTLIIETGRPFAYDEEIMVNISSVINTVSGENLQPATFSFHTMKADNNNLRIEYEQQILNEIQNQALQSKEVAPPHHLKSTNNSNLPEDFPELFVTVNKNPAPGYAFLTPNNPFAPPNRPSYAMMLDKYGTPVYYKKFNSAVADLKIQEAGNISHFLPSQSGGLGVIYGSHLIYDSYMNVVDTFQMGNGYLAEVHDFLLFNNGHSVMFTYDPQIVDMSQIVEGGDPAATVVGFVLQELDADKNVVFEWSSWDHIPITDAVPDIDLTKVFIDYVHGNAVEPDTDGNYLISFRHTDEIIKVSRETGEIIWRLNAYRENLNDFTFTNDTIKFSHQHDIRRLDNGHISIFDNGNLHWGPYSRVVEYALDEENMTVEQVWAYPAEPGHFDFAMAMGGAQRLEFENRTMIGWGISFAPMKMSSEVTYSDGPSWEIWTNFADTLRTYRAYKFDWTTDMFSFSKDTIDYGEFSGYTPEPYILQITNNSEDEINISGHHKHLSAFTVQQGIPVSIAAGETANVTVNFFPASQGQFEDVLTIYCTLGVESKIAKQVVLQGHTADATTPEISFNLADGTIDVSRKPEIKMTANEKLFNQDGMELSAMDLAGMIQFKKDDLNGEDVPFFAEVVWYETTKTEIIVHPVDSLGSGQEYYFALKGNTCGDWMGNIIDNNIGIAFTTENYAGIFTKPAIHFDVFPNPTSDLLQIKFPLEGNKSIEVLDFSGRSLGKMQAESGDLQFSIKNLPQGVYFIKVIFDNRQSGIAKIIKQ
ncbi:MAG: aryl-sulfate sulfotransferase [Bacteroidales bacterium]|nr:aryl-sulfate sulfotransferase [Bacteroidales bacterium]